MSKKYRINDSDNFPIPSEIIIHNRPLKNHIAPSCEHHCGIEYYGDEFPSNETHESSFPLEYGVIYEESQMKSLDKSRHLECKKENMTLAFCAITEAETDSSCSITNFPGHTIDDTCHISLISAITQDFFELECLISMIEKKSDIIDECIKPWTHEIKSTKIRRGTSGRRREKHPSVLNSIAKIR